MNVIKDAHERREEAQLEEVEVDSWGGQGAEVGQEQEQERRERAGRRRLEFRIHGKPCFDSARHDGSGLGDDAAPWLLLCNCTIAAPLGHSLDPCLDAAFLSCRVFRFFDWPTTRSKPWSFPAWANPLPSQEQALANRETFVCILHGHCGRPSISSAWWSGHNTVSAAFLSSMGTLLTGSLILHHRREILDPPLCMCCRLRCPFVTPLVAPAEWAQLVIVQVVPLPAIAIWQISTPPGSSCASIQPHWAGCVEGRIPSESQW